MRRRILCTEGASVACLDITPRVSPRPSTRSATRAQWSRDGVRRLGLRSIERQWIGQPIGRIEVLANVAGIGGFYHSHEMEVARFQKMIAVNLDRTFLMARATLPALLDGGGSIVNVASTAGIIGSAYSAAYSRPREASSC